MHLKPDFVPSMIHFPEKITRKEIVKWIERNCHDKKKYNNALTFFSSSIMISLQSRFGTLSLPEVRAPEFSSPLMMTKTWSSWTCSVSFWCSLLGETSAISLDCDEVECILPKQSSSFSFSSSKFESIKQSIENVKLFCQIIKVDRIYQNFQGIVIFFLHPVFLLAPVIH